MSCLWGQSCLQNSTNMQTLNKLMAFKSLHTHLLFLSSATLLYHRHIIVISQQLTWFFLSLFLSSGQLKMGFFSRHPTLDSENLLVSESVYWGLHRLALSSCSIHLSFPAMKFNSFLKTAKTNMIIVHCHICLLHIQISFPFLH